MCWVSAIRSVGRPRGPALGRRCGPVPTGPLGEAREGAGAPGTQPAGGRGARQPAGWGPRAGPVCPRYPVLGAALACGICVHTHCV